jgi:hypothetical protein
MQPARQLLGVLEEVSSPERYLFALADLRSALPEMSDNRLNVLLSRAVGRGRLIRVCRGIYLYPRVAYNPGLVLAHTAARLRAGHLLYLSLESALSEHGALSQLPLDRLTLMTSGRRGVIDCGPFGSLEFTHTRRTAGSCRGQLVYDAERRLWIASVALAWQDLQHVGRNLDLVVREEIEGEAHARL